MFWAKASRSGAGISAGPVVSPDFSPARRSIALSPSHVF